MVTKYQQEQLQMLKPFRKCKKVSHKNQKKASKLKKKTQYRSHFRKSLKRRRRSSRKKKSKKLYQLQSHRMKKSTRIRNKVSRYLLKINNPSSQNQKMKNTNLLNLFKNLKLMSKKSKKTLSLKFLPKSHPSKTVNHKRQNLQPMNPHQQRKSLKFS